jgi:hypothetical protein
MSLASIGSTLGFLSFLPQDSLISEEKLTKYLLIQLSKDDKSKFLAKAGYTLANWKRLEQDIRDQILTQPAEVLEVNQYGQKYSIRASLKGINGIELKILTIWMVEKNVAKFVTLVPDQTASL